MKLICPVVTGYRCSEPFVKILDNKNRPFYLKKNIKDVFYFNLPKGVYYTNNNLIELDKPVFYEPKKILKPVTQLPDKFYFTVCDNPNKCSIVIATGEIIVDKKIWNLPRFIFEFIIAHEIAHYFFPLSKSHKYDYSLEKKCDALATNWLLNRGYNPSQIHYATGLTLTDCKRRNLSTKKMKNIQFYI